MGDGLSVNACITIIAGHRSARYGSVFALTL